MDDNQTLQQARSIAELLPVVMRSLFAFEDDAGEELPLGQLRVCALLFGGPRPMSALSRELGVSLSAMTQLADRLERARMVKRVAEENDRRVRSLQLTERGEKMMRHREEARVQRVLAALERLSPRARKEVQDGLETLMKGCAAMKKHDPAKKPDRAGAMT